MRTLRFLIPKNKSAKKKRSRYCRLWSSVGGILVGWPRIHFFVSRRVSSANQNVPSGLCTRELLGVHQGGVRTPLPPSPSNPSLPRSLSFNPLSHCLQIFPGVSRGLPGRVLPASPSCGFVCGKRERGVTGRVERGGGGLSWGRGRRVVWKGGREEGATGEGDESASLGRGGGFPVRRWIRELGPKGGEPMFWKSGGARGGGTGRLGSRVPSETPFKFQEKTHKSAFVVERGKKSEILGGPGGGGLRRALSKGGLRRVFKGGASRRGRFKVEGKEGGLEEACWARLFSTLQPTSFPATLLCMCALFVHVCWKCVANMLRVCVGCAFCDLVLGMMLACICVWVLCSVVCQHVGCVSAGVDASVVVRPPSPLFRHAFHFCASWRECWWRATTDLWIVFWADDRRCDGLRNRKRKELFSMGISKGFILWSCQFSWAQEGLGDPRLCVCQVPCPNWVHFGSILGPFWVHFGSILGPFWVHFGSILGPFWVHFGSILGPFWVHSGSILGVIWILMHL